MATIFPNLLNNFSERQKPSTKASKGNDDDDGDATATVSSVPEDAASDQEEPEHSEDADSSTTSDENIVADQDGPSVGDAAARMSRMIHPEIVIDGEDSMSDLSQISAPAGKCMTKEMALLPFFILSKFYYRVPLHNWDILENVLVFTVKHVYNIQRCLLHKKVGF